MTTPQSHFTVTLPTTDNTGAALVPGQLTGLVFTVGTSTYSYALPAGVAPGAGVTALFSALSPVFAPVAGTSYTATAEAVDSGGDGIASAAIIWTEAAAVPAAPTGFSVG